MKIALAQISVEQSNFEANINIANNFASQASAQNTDIILFPEMFTCGFNYKANANYLAQNQSQFIEQICNIAKQNNIWLCGSVPFIKDKNFPPCNRMLLVDNKGNICASYDKIHLFSPFNENKHVYAGNNITVADTPFGKIGMAICYDLRFPEMWTAMMNANAQVVLLSAAWPHPRLRHWQVLTSARAIENQFFVVAVNQCGIENFGGAKAEYFGASVAISPNGDIVSSCEIDTPNQLAIAKINLEEIDSARRKIPVQKDRRQDLYK